MFKPSLWWKLCFFFRERFWPTEDVLNALRVLDAKTGTVHISICICAASSRTLYDYISHLRADGWVAHERPFIVGELHLCFLTKKVHSL